MKSYYALRPRLSTTFPVTTMDFCDGHVPIIDERAFYVTLYTSVLMLMHVCEAAPTKLCVKTFVS